MRYLENFIIIFSCSSLINACSNNDHIPVSSDHGKKTANHSSLNGYICTLPSQYAGSYLGDGECVDLVKICSNAPNTRYWKEGSQIFGNNSVPSGTAIATFKKGKYPNKKGYHAAIYSHQNQQGIFVWDQWKGQPIHLRFIRAHQAHKEPGNNASRYHIIQ